MRNLYTLILGLCLLVAGSAHASFGSKSERASTLKQEIFANEQMAKLFEADMQAFLKLTPKQYEKLTGTKLTLKETLKLKAAQKLLKNKMNKAGDGIPKGVYIILAILGWAWLIMGIKDDWSGNNWWVNLLLTFLCWLPGVIHAFIKMKEYY